MLESIYIVAIALYVIGGLFTFGIKFDIDEGNGTHMLLVFFIGLPLVLITWPFLLGIIIGSYMKNMVSNGL